MDGERRVRPKNEWKRQVMQISELSRSILTDVRWVASLVLKCNRWNLLIIVVRAEISFFERLISCGQLKNRTCTKHINGKIVNIYLLHLMSRSEWNACNVSEAILNHVQSNARVPKWSESRERKRERERRPFFSFFFFFICKIIIQKRIYEIVTQCSKPDKPALPLRSNSALASAKQMLKRSKKWNG